MSKPKFTPGPWDFDREIWWENTPGEQEKHGSLAVYTTDDENLTIATVNDYFDKEIGRANAALITAAPEMYEKLAYFHEQLKAEHIHGIPVETCQCRTAREWRSVNQVLRKARGEATTK